MTGRAWRAMLAVPVVAALLGLVVPGEAQAAGCRVRFVTSQPQGRWYSHGLWVDNNMWNADGYAVRQTLRACGPGRWRVTAKADNRRVDWQVKSYPNVHRDWHDWNTGAEPPLAGLRTIRARFRTTAPDRGIHDTAFDVWLDGVPGVAGVREVMIWTARRRLQPFGHIVQRGVHVAGRTWTLWSARGGDYLALVPRREFDDGTVRVLAVLRWLTRHGRLPADATLGQLGFGFEIVSTGGRPATFRLDRFALTAH